MQKAQEIGLDGFLIKPVSASILFDAIMQTFGKAVPETSRAPTGQKQEAVALENLQGARVLLVEDNEINQQVAKEILEGAGLIVSIANNGREAVAAVTENRYDAVLMDVQMPEMDGYEATRKIRELQLVAHSSKLNAEDRDQKTEVGRQRSAVDDQSAMSSAESNPEGGKKKVRELGALHSVLSPQPSVLPIIAMTAHAMAGDEQKSLAAGMNDHVTKPIDPDQLFAALQRWIKPAAERTAVRDRLPAPGGAAIRHASERTDRTVPGLDELPESLPGFDLAAGLSRLMGNKRLYRKLLLDLGANYGAAAQEIREALAADDYNRAHSLVHNLKGLAGNLAATDLQAAAVAMERLVKGQAAQTASDKELNRKMSDLEDALDQALYAVQALGSPAEKQVAGSTDDVIFSIPPELARKAADRIRTAAEMGDVMQVTSIARELKTESEVLIPFCDQIMQLADNFDLDGILKLASELNR
jgi:CheY-like chemotaxis protein/HPt (histidine-containing phosphotransfer) domain-containing protein